VLDALHDLEWSSKARAKLAVKSRHQGLHRAVEDLQQHPVIHLELQRPVLRIILLLGILLGLQQQAIDSVRPRGSCSIR
jgi:hypothetical protein